LLHLFQLFLPYILAAFFVYKGLKEPLYLLGIPFLIFMGNSIFFDHAKLFHNPGSLGDQLLFLIWLFALWILSETIPVNRKNTIEIGQTRLNIPLLCIICLTIITVINFVSIVFSYPIQTDIFKQFVNDVSLFIGYYIIKNWSSKNDPEVIKNFLYTIVVINTIAAILFILHQGFHFKIYQEEEYFTQIINGQEITRSFTFMPQFLFFSIIYILIFTKKYSFIAIGILMINLLAIFISYTRSSIINVGIVFLLYFFFIALKKRNFKIIFKKLTFSIVLAISIILLVSKFLPANTKYIMDRFSEISLESSKKTEPTDMQYRFANSAAVISKLPGNKKMFGMGSVTKAQTPEVIQMQETTADMVWPGVIYRWGFAGLILFILIYLFSSINAFNFYFRTEGILSDFSLLFLIYIISQFVESFVSWTFLSAHGSVTGLWYFAILSSILKFKKASFNNNERLESIKYIS